MNQEQLNVVLVSQPVIKPSLGYYELLHKPTQDELTVYYVQKYDQNEHCHYRKQYTSDEFDYCCAKNQQKFLALQPTLSGVTENLLDIGCGEGFTRAFFKEKDWDVKGTD